MESGINLGHFTSPLLGVQMKDSKSLTKDWAIFTLALLGMAFLTLSGGYSRGVAFEKSTAEKNHLNLTGHASSNELPFNDQLASPLYQSGRQTQARVKESYGKLPLSFEPNYGQTDLEGPVQHYSSPTLGPCSL